MPFVQLIVYFGSLIGVFIQLMLVFIQLIVYFIQLIISNHYFNPICIKNIKLIKPFKLLKLSSTLPTI